MLASGLIIALYLAVPITLVASALLRSEIVIRREAVPLKVSARIRTARGLRSSSLEQVRRRVDEPFH